VSTEIISYVKFGVQQTTRFSQKVREILITLTLIFGVQQTTVISSNVPEILITFIVKFGVRQIRGSVRNLAKLL
jgi:hypothetical protein